VLVCADRKWSFTTWIGDASLRGRDEEGKADKKKEKNKGIRRNGK